MNFYFDLKKLHLSILERPLNFHCNNVSQHVNAEADVRTQMSSIKPEIKQGLPKI